LSGEQIPFFKDGGHKSDHIRERWSLTRHEVNKALNMGQMGEKV